MTRELLAREESSRRLPDEEDRRRDRNRIVAIVEIAVDGFPFLLQRRARKYIAARARTANTVRTD